LEEPAASIIRVRCPEEGDEKFFVEVGKHLPRHTVSHSKDRILKYTDLSSCKMIVIREVEKTEREQSGHSVIIYLEKTGRNTKFLLCCAHTERGLMRCVLFGMK
jgi:hypothetical protein